MTDVVDKATRSRMMSGVRGKNTRPEILLRRGLHALGFRFRLHARDIPGKPDIVFPKYRALIIVHGCFWHGHDCRYFKLPATNTDFWKTKIDGNRERDKRILRRQRQDGWRCLLVWECAIRMALRHPEKLDVISLSAQWLKGESSLATIDETGFQIQPDPLALDIEGK
jgi:DNA mismatch endonuclease (patch repair protein)